MNANDIHEFLASFDRRRTDARARTLAPPHDDLDCNTSTDLRWLHLFTDTGEPAVWDATWFELTGTSPDPETDGCREEERHERGTFADLHERITAILGHEHRTPGTRVDLRVCEWALHFQLPQLYPSYRHNR